MKVLSKALGNPLLKARACLDACDLNASELVCHISGELFKPYLDSDQLSCFFLGPLPSLVNLESEGALL